MCDPSDIFVVPQIKAAHNEQPTIFIYDRYPGGIGLSEKVYDQIEQILEETTAMIERCPCKSGCPSCIGTDHSLETAKVDSLKLLHLFLQK